MANVFFQYITIYKKFFLLNTLKNLNNGKKLLKYFQSVEICPKLVTLVATNLGHLEFVEI